MLISQGFLRLLDLCAGGAFQDVRSELLTYKLPIMLFQICTRILGNQAEDGSFGTRSSREETAYAIIALSNLISLPFILKSPIISEAYTAISKGRQFLRNDGGLGAPYIVSKDYLWVEKVTYASNYLQNAYILAAFQANIPAYDFGNVLDKWIVLPFEKVKGFSKFYSQLPLFKRMPNWQIQASLIEGYLFLPQLAKVKLSVFDRKGLNEDKYFEYIPFSWIGPNNVSGTFTGPGLLYDLMVIALLNYQVDEYIEAVVGVEFKDDLDGVLAVVEAIFAQECISREDFDDNALQQLTKSLETPELLEKTLKSPVGNGFQATTGDLGMLPSPTPSPIKRRPDSGVPQSSAASIAPSIKSDFLASARASRAASSPPSIMSPSAKDSRDTRLGSPGPLSVEIPSIAEQSLISPAISETSNYDSDHGNDDAVSPCTSPSIGGLSVEEAQSLSLGIPTHLLPVYEKLSYFVSTILNHPHIQNASQYDKDYLSQELHAYLRTQVGQGVNNESLRSQKDRRTLRSPPSNYLKWARGSGGEHVSCYYAFAFLVCLLSHRLGGEECFANEEQKYLAHAACMHLAAMCRMYNDLGSVPRDRDEGNLNSINFPEFRAYSGRTDKDMKSSLLRIAEFERRCFESCMEGLEEQCAKDRKRVAQVVKMFSMTTDYYGQLYVLRDMTCRI